MNIVSPALNIDTEASDSLIKKLVRQLKGVEDNPYIILAQDDLTYVQAVYVGTGFILEYQDGSIDKHFKINELLSVPKVQSIFCSFLARDLSWKNEYPIERKIISGMWYRIGHKIGYFLGRFIQGFKDAQHRK